MNSRAGTLAWATLLLGAAGLGGAGCSANANEGSGGTTPAGLGGATGGAYPTGGTGATSATGGAVGTGATGGAPTAAGPCVPGTAYPAPNLAGAVASPIYTGTGEGLFEGVVWVAQVGALFFSDMSFTADVPPSAIHRLTPPATVAPFVPSSGSNGLAVNTLGQIVACTHDTQSLSLFDPNTGARAPSTATNHLGQTFNSPNDLTIHANGTIYFTDPDWQLGTSRTSGSGITGVYGVTTTGTVFLVDGTRDKPNGIALSPDGATLYVGDVTGAIGTYPVLPDGTTGARTEFAAGVEVPDGMTVDCLGNLYTTSHNAGLIRVFSPAGVELGSINVGASLTNVAFGGADGMTLYATAAKTLYAISMNVPGYPY